MFNNNNIIEGKKNRVKKPAIRGVEHKKKKKI